MYVANNQSIIVFLFCNDSIADSTLCISWCTYIIYNIKIIYVYKIRFSQQNMHTIITITVDFVIDVQKCVCIIFCRVIS